MPLIRCLGCGALIMGGSYCARCKQGSGWGRSRNRQAQARFRAAVLAKDNYRCTFRENGKRCVIYNMKLLVAHHDEPGNDDPTTGRTLCKWHHREIDRHAR